MFGFVGVVVGVVGDLAGFVGGDGLAFHDPFDGGFAVDDVVVGFGGDVAEGDVGIVVDDSFVGKAFAGFGVFGFAETHFGDVEVVGGELFGREFACVEGDGILFGAFVVEMQVGEAAAGLAEGAEGFDAFDGGDAGQLFAEVVGVAGAVVGRVEESVDVVEEILFGEGLAGIGFLEVGQSRVADPVPADVAVLAGGFFGSREEIVFRDFFLGFFVKVKGEALALFKHVIPRQCIHNES